MSQYFPKSCRRFGGNINVKIDLSNHATKTELKNEAGIDTSNFSLEPTLIKFESSSRSNRCRQIKNCSCRFK